MSPKVKDLSATPIFATQPVEGIDFTVYPIDPLDVNSPYDWHGCRGTIGSGIGPDERDMLSATHEQAVQDAVQTIKFMQSRPFNEPTFNRDYSIEEINPDCFYWSSHGPTFGNLGNNQGPYMSEMDASEAAESFLTKAYEQQPSKFPIQKHHLVYEKHDVEFKKEQGLGTLTIQQLDTEIAKRAIAGGLTTHQAFNMIATNSMEATSLAQRKGSTPAYNYVSSIMQAVQPKNALSHKAGKGSGIGV